MPFGVKYHRDFETRRLRSTTERELEHYDLVDTWTVFQEVHSLGWAKAIGLSNFNKTQMDRIWAASKVKPSNLQLECHAYLQQRELRVYCEAKGMAVSAYSPIGSPGRPPHQRKSGDPNLIDEPVLLEIANKHRKTVAQVLLKFLGQHNIAVLPKSSTLSRLKENLDIFDFSLDNDDINNISNLDRNFRYFRFEWAMKHPEYSANEPF